MKTNTIESLLELVEPVTESGCWIFMGMLTEKGYARVSFQGKRVRLHRLFYEHFIGPIPPGLVPDHLCRVRCCGNPHHTEPVTNHENLKRGQGVVGRAFRETTCRKGHEWTPDNTIVRHGGGRACRACEFIRSQIRTANRKLKAQP